MLNDKWITINLEEARKSHIHVTEAVVIKVRELLNGQFIVRQLTSAELKSISMNLLEGMASNAPKMDAEQ